LVPGSSPGGPTNVSSSKTVVVMPRVRGCGTQAVLDVELILTLMKH
jgi:hypothetical protein